MNNPTTMKVDLTVAQLIVIRDALKHVRGDMDYTVSRKDWTGYNTDEISGYTVEQAEKNLEERAKLADLIYFLTGEVIAEDAENQLAVAEGRRLLNAQKARQAAEELADA
jgi:hypothetical protein